MGVFGNTFSGNEKYLFRDCENFLSPIEMELSFKPKTFSDLLVQFLESTSHFEHLKKKDHRHSYFTSEITDCQSHG